MLPSLSWCQSLSSWLHPNLHPFPCCIQNEHVHQSEEWATASTLISDLVPWDTCLCLCCLCHEGEKKKNWTNLRKTVLRKMASSTHSVNVFPVLANTNSFLKELWKRGGQMETTNPECCTGIKPAVNPVCSSGVDPGFGRGGGLSPKFAQIRGFSLKIAWKLHDFDNNLAGKGGAGRKP